MWLDVALSKPSKLVGLILLHKKANHIDEILDPQGRSYKNALVCVPVCMYVMKINFVNLFKIDSYNI